MDNLLAENNFPAGATAPAQFQSLTGNNDRSVKLHYQSAAPVSPLEKDLNRFTKRFIDIILSVILIICILSWMIPLFAILIKLDSRGPVFFRQKRNRNGGRLFTCIKFRTMIVNKEADLLAARKNDERITAFGKFLRHYHFDELPQLLNVLCGQMSVVGPRPYMVSENIHYENLLESYSYRHTVRPGITGLAQSFGYVGSFHDLQKVKERVQLDILYIRKWSLGMDIKILYRTFMAMLGCSFHDELKNF